MGTATMPMFFLLSGFVLVLHDGQTLWSKRSSALSSGTEQHEDSALPNFDTLRFYHKRAARILPVYYLTSALAVIPTLQALALSAADPDTCRRRFAVSGAQPPPVACAEHDAVTGAECPCARLSRNLCSAADGLHQDIARSRGPSNSVASLHAAV